MRSTGIDSRQAVLDRPFAKFTQADAGARGCLWNQAVFGQTRDRVDFQDPRTSTFVETNIDAGQALRSNGRCGLPPCFDNCRADMRWHVEFESVDRRSVFVLGGEVEKLPRRFDLDERERLIIEQAHGPFRAGDGLLQDAEIVEAEAIPQRGRQLRCRFHETDAQARPLRVGLENQGKSDSKSQLERPLEIVKLVDKHVGRGRNAALKQPFFRGRLAERQPGGFGPTSGVEHVHAVKRALDFAVFSFPAVEGQKGDVDVVEVGRLWRSQRRIQANDFVATRAETVGDRPSALEADFPFVGLPSA